MTAWVTNKLSMERIKFFIAFVIIFIIHDRKLVGSEVNNIREVVKDTNKNETSFEYHLQEDGLPVSNRSLSCNSNQWVCGGKCINKREYCTENSQCHPTYPIPCGDKARCYRHVYICYTIQI